MIGTLKFVPYKRKSLIRIPYKRIIFVLFQIENDWDHLKPFLISENLLYSHPLYPKLTVLLICVFWAEVPTQIMSKIPGKATTSLGF